VGEVDNRFVRLSNNVWNPVWEGSLDIARVFLNARIPDQDLVSYQCAVKDMGMDISIS
jgi:hypothetical protein